MKVSRIAQNNFRQWLINPQNAAALFCLALYTYDQLYGMTDFAAYLNSKITQWMMPFLLGSASRMIPVMLLFLLLISESPFRTRQQSFVIQRTGKRAWINGQLLYLFIISIGYTALVWLFSWIWYVSELKWSSEWGESLITASRGLDPAVFDVFLDFSYRIIRNTDPLVVTAWCSTVMILVCYMLGVILTICNLYLRKGVGAIVTSSLVGLSLIPELFSVDPGLIKMTIWISPVTWMDRALMGNESQNLPSYAFGILAPAIISIILSMLLILTIGKCDVETDKE